MGWLGKLFGGGGPRGFTDELIAALHRHSEVRSVERNDAQRTLKVSLKDGTCVSVNLANMEVDYSRLPASERQDWLARVVGQLTTPAEAPPFQKARDSLRPALRPDDYPYQSALAARVQSPKPGAPLEDPAPVRREVAEGLDVFGVLDRPDGLRYLIQEDLDRWGVGPYEVFEAALENLRAATDAPPREENGIFVSPFGDSYDASRALLPDWIQSAPVRGERLVAIPSRDHLRIGGPGDAERLLEEAEELHLREPRPISRRLFVLEDGILKPWAVSPGHPLHPKVRLAALADRAAQYGPQKESLDGIHEKEGTDIFVASFKIFERDGRCFSVTTWTPDVHAWLPRTEVVAFMPEGQSLITAPWEAVRDIVGHRMKELPGLRPVRFEVTTYPIAAELSQLRAAAEAS